MKPQPTDGSLTIGHLLEDIRARIDLLDAIPAEQFTPDDIADLSALKARLRTVTAAKRPPRRKAMGRPAHGDIRGKGKEAYEYRQKGLSWAEIACITGVMGCKGNSTWAITSWAKAHAQLHGLDWPVGPRGRHPRRPTGRRY